MGDAGVAVVDKDRLPWLEPYRAPRPKQAVSKAGVAAVAAVSLAGLTSLLVTRDWSTSLSPDPEPEASIALPAPVELQPQIVLPPLEPRAEAGPREQSVAAPQSAKAKARRRISARPERRAYRKVVKAQAAAAPPVSEAAIAIASLAEPPRPAVNPEAQVARGKTAQLGVFLTQREAEIAWQGAVRDYTYLVTLPKSIEPVRYRSKRYYSLQLGTPSKRFAKQLCSNLKSIGRACTVA